MIGPAAGGRKRRTLTADLRDEDRLRLAYEGRHLLRKSFTFRQCRST